MLKNEQKLRKSNYLCQKDTQKSIYGVKDAEMRYIKQDPTCLKCLDPLSDFGFKYMFGRPQSARFLLDFLNDLFSGEQIIQEIQYLNTEHIGVNPKDRGIILDVLCITEQKTHFIVEMQNRMQVHFRERALYYLSKLIVEQGQKGADWQFDIQAIYGVFFINFTISGFDDYRVDACMVDVRSQQIFCDKMRQIFIQLPLFTKSQAACTTSIEQWIYILKNMETTTLESLQMAKPIFRELLKMMNRGSLSLIDMSDYEQVLKIRRDNYGMLKYAEESGIKKGIEEGIEKGIEKGRAEMIRTTALNLKQKGINMDIIMEVTGLSAQEIQNIQ
ncbi:MAG: Rpn family recombination-promoting nuclease/putative transposase [Bacteroidales bacterium]